MIMSSIDLHSFNGRFIYQRYVYLLMDKLAILILVVMGVITTPKPIEEPIIEKGQWSGDKINVSQSNSFNAQLDSTNLQKLKGCIELEKQLSR